MVLVFFFNETATTETYPLPLHDALPILAAQALLNSRRLRHLGFAPGPAPWRDPGLQPWRGASFRSRDPHQDRGAAARDRKSTRLNSSHANISYAVFCLKKKT